MNTKSLRYFVAVAEKKNFTRAAEMLHIAQPALSIAIKKLEQSMELTLLRRNEKEVTLTDEGERLYIHAKEILQKIQDATWEMKELKGLVKGEVRLGVPSMLGSYFFPDILMEFKQLYPHLKLTIVDAGTQSIRKMLLSGELDLGVILNDNVPESLDVEPIIRDEMVAVVSPNNPIALKETISYAEFFSHELIMFKKGYFHREMVDRLCEQNQLDQHISIETNLIPMILKVVQKDFAISALLKLVTQFEKGVVPIPFEEPIFLNIAIAWRKTGYLSLADKAFMQFTKQRLGVGTVIPT
ncbi:LysR family transcriptional regulator [Vibrio rumoiensis]|uniref:LysR family transcriptional regulator n=1 Tax=Vibrio rumoiensis 1S-45 TaxID=1188252 RepID=A0A1E5E6J5_9VIBR|nr:LysR family transcriptional regulator [Vibrio rumoiensis]OEF30133.1 LysR family transcriptional regulator [Vibrio rumoiensis 1S-45]